MYVCIQSTYGAICFTSTTWLFLMSLLFKATNLEGSCYSGVICIWNYSIIITSRGPTQQKPLGTQKEHAIMLSASAICMYNRTWCKLRCNYSYANSFGSGRVSVCTAAVCVCVYVCVCMSVCQSGGLLCVWLHNGTCWYFILILLWSMYPCVHMECFVCHLEVRGCMTPIFLYSRVYTHVGVDFNDTLWHLA